MGRVNNRGLMFFTNTNEFNVLSQAVERIFPEDDLGPVQLDLVFLISSITNWREITEAMRRNICKDRFLQVNRHKAIKVN